MKHRERHPVPVDGCFGCRVMTVQVAPSATPSRRGGRQAAEAVAREKRWDKDHAAYRRMWADGLSPHTLDGAAELEAKAKGKADVEMFMGASSMVEEVPNDAA